MPELPLSPPYFLVSWTPNSTYWANLMKHDETHYPQKECLTAGMKQTQFLSSPVGMLYWAGLTTLSQLKGKDKGGEVPNNRFQTVTIQPQKGITTIHNCLSEGWLYKEENLYQKQSEACKSVKARILCWRCRTNTDIVGECSDLWIAVLFSGSHTALQPTSHKKHRPSHFLLTFIHPLIPFTPPPLFNLCLLHYLSFSAPLFHPPCFFFRLSTQLNSFPFLASPQLADI